MTGVSQETDELVDRPVISIQSDWEDFIFGKNQEVWISSKFAGREGTHSKLKSDGANYPICISSDFSVLSVGKNLVEIMYNPTGHVTAFVAPSKTFSTIHRKKIHSLDVSDKGLGVSTCAEDKLVVWNSGTGEITQVLSGHLGSVYKCKFFPSGVVILSAGADMQLKIWSAETGDCPVKLCGHRAAINDFCVVDRGRNIISVSKDGTSKLWDCGKAACLATVFKSESILNCCALGILPENINLTREEAVNEREIGTKDKLLVIGSEEGFVYGIGVYSRKKIFQIEVGSPVNTILMHSNILIIGCQSGTIKIYKFVNVLMLVKIINESASPIVCGCLFRENGFFLGRNDGTVTYYNFQNYSSKRIVLTGSDIDPVYDVAVTNNKVFTCCRDGKIRQYCIHEGNIPKYFCKD